MKTKQETIGLHLKIDSVLTKLLETQYLTKTFTFKVEEEVHSDEPGAVDMDA
jgi:hypothetical protein